MLASTPAARAQQPAADPAAKAAFLVKLAPFVDWPAAAFAAPADPFVICIVGPDTLGAAMDKAAAGQRVNDHAVAVRRLDHADRAAGCQIMYLPSGGAQPIKDALQAVEGAPVLTVTEASDPPGMIDLAFVQGQIRFRVDDAAAAESGLSISSKLLSLAMAVRPRPPEGGRP